MNLNFKKTVIIWGILTFCLVVWLFNANNLIVMFCIPEENRIKKTNIKEYESNSEVYTKVTRELSQGDFFENFVLSGGSFCETQEDNPGRRIEVILRSDLHTYTVTGVNTVRPDIYYEFLPSINLSGGNVGFEADFSTVNIADGIYDLYMAVYENEHAYGISNTGKKYEKDWRGFKPYEYKEIDCDFSDIEEIPELVFRIDNVSFREDGNFSMNGWGICKEMEADRTIDVIQATFSDGTIKYYEVEKYMRIDISKAFGDEYLYSGIIGDLDGIVLQDNEICKLRYGICVNEKLYLSHSYEEVTFSEKEGLKHYHVDNGEKLVYEKSKN